MLAIRYPEAVPQMLDGGDQKIIARIRKLDIKVDLLPQHSAKKLPRKTESKKPANKGGKLLPSIKNNGKELAF